jgi:hypothetical protein
MIEFISVSAYIEMAEDLNVQETIMLAGCWPLSVGTHPDLGPVALVHCGDVAAIITPPQAIALQDCPPGH